MADKFFKLCDSLGFKRDVYKNLEETEFHRAKYGGNGVRLVFYTNSYEIKVAKDFFTSDFGYTIMSAGFSVYNVPALKKCIEDIQTISNTNETTTYPGTASSSFKVAIDEKWFPTKEQIEEPAKEVFSQPEPAKRRVYVRNAHHIMDGDKFERICTDDDCVYCMDIFRLFTEEGLKRIKKLYSNDKPL